LAIARVPTTEGTVWFKSAAPHGDPIAGWRESLVGLVEGTIALGEA